mmetsp:Transcript_108928/g.306968  ORF Transcript_108928/g.306968 Transcript_108928/m.306968 type:complete len:330 (+) Transcript_108928:596-1585(+)
MAPRQHPRMESESRRGRHWGRIPWAHFRLNTRRHAVLQEVEAVRRGYDRDHRGTSRKKTLADLGRALRRRRKVEGQRRRGTAANIVLTARPLVDTGRRLSTSQPVEGDQGATEKLVALQFSQAVPPITQAVAGHLGEQTLHKIVRTCGWDMPRQRERSVQDLIEHDVLVGRVERRLPHQHLVENATERPQVKGESFPEPSCIPKHFRRNVVRSARESRLPLAASASRVAFALVGHAYRCVEIDHLQMTIMREQHVLRLQVPVRYPFRPQVRQNGNNLAHIELSELEGASAHPRNLLGELSAGHRFQDEVHVPIVLECEPQTYNAWVVER